MAFDVGSILALWDNKGIFEFVFPFLLIFAFVFGILQKVNIFGGPIDANQKSKPNRGLNATIAVVVGLMSIRFQFVRDVMGDFVARGAVGILILIMMLILISMFITEGQGGTKKNWYIIFSIIAAIVFIVILAQSFSNYGSYSISGYLGGDLIGWIVGAVLLIGIIVAVAVSSSD